MSILPILIAVALGSYFGSALASSDMPSPESESSALLEISPLPQEEGRHPLDRPQDLWARIRGGFRLTEVNPELTRRLERDFVERVAHLQRAIQRSRPYLYHIVDEVERRDMPMEIALLPLVESGFNPIAESPRKASGIWQFIPSTGRVFGLKQNAWYDGRRDILASTRAALDYLEILYRRFGSWELALAAYNCGEGCLARAIARNRMEGLPTDYTALPLPIEARHYVPKLLAVRNLVQNPQAWGLTLPAIENKPYFAQVRISQPMSMRQVAWLADIRLEELLALNPAFQRRIVHTDTHGDLLLPTDKVDIFHENLQRMGVGRPTLQLYQARQGESLQRIADQFGVTLEWLKEHNPIMANRGRLTTAQSLYVPRPPAKPGRNHLVQNESTSPLGTRVRKRDI